jgi:hypothetical protein
MHGVAAQSQVGPALALPAVEPVPPAESKADAQTRQAIREVLDLLPKDVVRDLNSGAIDLNDPAFMDGLMDHVSRLALADPRNGHRALGKMIRLKKQIARSVRLSDPDAVVSSTVQRTGERVGRNDPCPCRSGRKYKQCCLRKQ